MPLLLLSLCSAPSAQKPTVIPMLESSVHLPVISVMVNGKGPFKFGFDTGAQGIAHLNANLIDQLKPEVTGEVMGSDGTGRNPKPLKLYRLNEVRIGDLVLHDVQASSLGSIGGPVSTEISGIIGFATFKDYLLKLDYANHQMTLMEGALDPKAPNVAPITLQHEIPSITISLAGKELSCHIDSGSSGALLVPGSLAKDLPLNGEPLVVGKAKTITNEFNVLEASLKGDAVIAGHSLKNPTLQFSEIFSHGNIGYEVLKHFAITFDQRNKLVRLEGNTDWQSKPTKHYGFHPGALSKEGLVVAEVELASVAEKAGLKSGDLIVKINGLEVASLTQEQIGRLMARPTVSLQVKRGEQTIDIRMRLDD